VLAENLHLKLYIPSINVVKLVAGLHGMGRQRLP
jgi:hypothetical protein